MCQRFTHSAIKLDKRFVKNASLTFFLAPKPVLKMYKHLKTRGSEYLYPLAGAFSCSVLSQPAVKGLNIFTARARYSPRAGDILFDQ